MEHAAEHAGITGEVGKALTETYLIATGLLSVPKRQERVAELGSQFSAEQRADWVASNYPLRST